MAPYYPDGFSKDDPLLSKHKENLKIQRKRKEKQNKLQRAERLEESMQKLLTNDFYRKMYTNYKEQLGQIS